VDTVLKGGYCDPRTTGPLVFVLLRPTLLDDEDVVGVRHVCGGVRRPQGAEQLGLYQESSVCGAHCSSHRPYVSSHQFLNLISQSKIEPLRNMFNLW
jgi:hypothetical protein